MAKTKSLQNLYYITLVLPEDRTKKVAVKAATKDTAIRRAMKRNPAAIDVKE